MRLSSGLLDGAFECSLLRMDAAARFNPHEHAGHVEFRVLDGALIDCDGQLYNKGDYARFEPGSKQASHSPAGLPPRSITRPSVGGGIAG